MRRRVEKYKKAAGQPGKEVPAELMSLEAEVRRLKAEIEVKKAAGVSDADLSKLHATLAGVEARYRKLMVEFERAKP